MSKNAILLEICANSLDSAIYAEQAGAKRIELCSGLELGGLTPSPATILLARKKLSLSIFVLIRPRTGDFCYSEWEWEAILENIDWCKQAGVDGIVCGALLPNGNIDIDRTRQLVERSHPLPFTFHRAFDRTPDPFSALEQLIDLDVDRILTSGQGVNAIEGTAVLKQLVEQANGRITILGGAGINSNNVKSLVQNTGLKEVHLSGKKKIAGKVLNRKDDPTFNEKEIEEGAYYITAIEEIQKVLEILAK